MSNFIAWFALVVAVLNWGVTIAIEMRRHRSGRAAARGRGKRMSENVSSRTAETISVLCPVCGVRVHFRPIVQAVTIRNAHDVLKPSLVVGLQSNTVVQHACQERIGATS